jgi:hypothetical protein
MYATRCPECLSELVLNERKVVRLTADDSTEPEAQAEAIFTCLVCGSDVVAAWLPAQRSSAEVVEGRVTQPRLK